MKSVYLCRVSSKEQEQEGYSLSSQEKLLSEYGDRKELIKVKVFSFAESASLKKQRTIFDEMMSYVKRKGIKIIVCEKTDRFTRNLRDLIGVYYWLEGDPGRQLHLVKDGLILHKNSHSQEKFNLDMRVVQAKNYVDNLSEEVKKGQKEKLESGWTPSSPPLGYKAISHDGKIIHVKDEKYASLVTRMLNLYASGNYSVERLADLMYHEGFRSKKGFRVTTSRVHGYLVNPYYCGKISWMGQIYQGKQDPLIDQDTYDRIRQILTQKCTPKHSLHSFLFRGLIRCTECSGIITWETHKGITYGHCNHYRKCAQTVWVKEFQVGAQLTSALQLLQIKNKRIQGWIYKAILASHEFQFEHHKRVLADLLFRKDQLSRQLSVLVDMRTSLEIDKDTYNLKRDKYHSEQELLQRSIDKHKKYEDKYVDLGIKFFEISQHARDRYEKLLPDKKRALINLIYSSITLDQGKVSFTYSRAFQILAKAVSATNSSKIADIVKLPKSIFELSEKVSPTIQNPHFVPSYSAVRSTRVWNNLVLIAPTLLCGKLYQKMRHSILIA